MPELTAFDVAYRGLLTDDLSDFLKSALDESRVLTVSANGPAVKLAEHAEAIQADVVNVVDDAFNTIGYIFPGWVTRQVRSNIAPADSLHAAVEILDQEVRPPGRGHLHEWLNLDRPTLRTCPGAGADPPHKTFWVPCLDHGK